CTGTTTDLTGYAIYPTGPISSYTVCEVPQAGWTQSYPKPVSTSGGAVVTTVSGVNCWSGSIGTASGTGLDFGNYVQLSGLKFYDADTSGTQNNGEAGIQSFKINITYCATGATCTSATPGALSTQVTTGPNGTFTWNAPGSITSFLVCEVLPTTGGWVQTTTGNSGNCWSGTVGSGTQTALTFGNICQGAGGALSKGFWSNKNGQSVLSANDQAWRHVLNGDLSCPGPFCAVNGPAPYLRNLDGSYYSVSTSASFSTVAASFGTWLTSGTSASNMAGQLSAQTAAMALNVDMVGGASFGLGPVGSGALVYAGPAPAACSVPGLTNGFISITNLLNYSVNQLRNDGLTTAAGTDRTCQTWAELALDSGNNNKNFVQAKACPVIYP
ncbi:MAG TPA: hypothetical protein VGH38_20870, partial [Bryobacteraceae bacterium]